MYELNKIIKTSIGVVNLESESLDIFDDFVVKKITEICGDFARKINSYNYFSLTFEKIADCRVLRYLQ